MAALYDKNKKSRRGWRTGMTIKCTAKEKGLLTLVFVESSFCPFNFIHCSERDTCKECFEKNVEWQIKDGKQE